MSATGVPATLTADGAPAFADFYEPGTALDPVSFEATLTGPTSVEAGSRTVGDDGVVELTWDRSGRLPDRTGTGGTHRG